MSKDSVAKDSQRITALLHDMSTKLQTERDYSVLFDTTNKTAVFNELSKARKEVDEVLPSVLSGLMHDKTSQELKQSVEAYQKELVVIRANIDRLLLRRSDIIDSFGNVLDRSYLQMLSYCFSTSEARSCMALHTMSKMLNELSLVRANGVQLATSSRFSSSRSRFTGAVDRHQFLYDQLLLLVPSQALLINTTYSSSSYARFSQLVESLQNSTRLDPELFFNVSSQFLLEAHQLHDTLNDIVTYAIHLTYVSSAVQISVIILVVVGCFISACLCSFCFSQTIVGPWRRLNHLQENTIAKFVPKDMLGMLNVSRIADIQYGLVQQHQITLVYASVKNFGNICLKMTPQEKFNFFNHVLQNASPIIRQFGGFIDTFQGDGFVAVFRKANDGVKACIELHRYVDQINKNPQYPAIQLCSGIATGPCLVGTIGEMNRMNVTIYSDIGTNHAVHTLIVSQVKLQQNSKS